MPYTYPVYCGYILLRKIKNIVFVIFISDYSGLVFRKPMCKAKSRDNSLRMPSHLITLIILNDISFARYKRTLTCVDRNIRKRKQPKEFCSLSYKLLEMDTQNTSNTTLTTQTFNGIISTSNLLSRTLITLIQINRCESLKKCYSPSKP